MKRFFKAAQVVATADGFEIALDGRPVRTPGRSALAVPAAALAAAIADEWNKQGDKIDPRSMPLTGLANAAIDRISPDPERFARGLAVYGESDLLCYRAEGPSPLVCRQAEQWDPILDWATRRFDVAFETVTGIVHRPQPPATIERLQSAVLARTPFELAGLSPLVTVSGSILVALALAEQAIGFDEAWRAATLDEQWQAEKWGVDDEASKALAGRRADFEAGARFLALL
ncbi:MAG TPA: ATP12 family protein [Allosphingosinicella sp.]|nr:ATP12 family protein [Allosphingosinicella sp.]